MNSREPRDALTRFSFTDAPVRGAIVQLDASWQEVRRRANPAQPIEALLGEALAAVALLKSTVKLDGSVSLQLQSAGALKLLFAQCNHASELRGLARLHEDAAELAFADLLSAEARLAITLEPRAGDQRYQGIVALEGDSLSESIGAYFERSEQLSTFVLLAANDQRAAGFLLQRLPGEGGLLQSQNVNYEDLKMLASTLRPSELLTLAPEAVLHRLFHAQSVLMQPPSAHRFGCSCSRERVGAMLRGLGRAEALAALTERGQVEVDCEFCNAHYLFDLVDLEALFKDALDPVVGLQ